MLGTALTVVFGAVQAATGDDTWPGLVLAVLGFTAAGIANTYRRSRPLAGYLTARAKAEQLRSAYFLYISGVSGLDARGLEATAVNIEYPTSRQDRE